MFLSKNGGLHTECRTLHFRHFLIEPLRRKVNNVLSGLKPALLRRLGTQMLRPHRTLVSTGIVRITSVRHRRTSALQIKENCI